MRIFYAISSLLLAAVGAPGQFAPGAYRVAGQSDLRQNGINRVLGTEVYAPGGVAVDGRDGTPHLYVSDTRNNRVLAWRDASSYQTGDPPAIVLGQPSARHSGAMGIGAKGFSGPMGLAVDPLTGNLYVADTGNHRVLRFPNPFANPSRVEPDAVYGQATFEGRSANPAGISRNSLYAPRALAFDSAGNLWVADSGNHRVLRFNAAVLDRTSADADLALGQRDFITGAANRGTGQISASGLDTPAGLAFDAQGHLYVSDMSNARVLRFAAPQAMDAAAGSVFGQPGYTTRSVSSLASNGTLHNPAGLAIDGAGNLYVAAPGDNRIMVFAASAQPGSAAQDVLGQTDFNTTLPNPFSYPLASSRSFAGASDVAVDGSGNLYVADTGNNRVLLFPRGAKTAAAVWGQNDFSANGINQVKAGSVHTPFKVVVDYSQSPNALYVSDTGNHRVLGWKDAIRFRSGDAADVVIGQPDFSTAVPNVDTRGAQDPSRTSLSSPKGLAVDGSGNLFVADTGNNRVLRFPRPVDQAGRVTPDMVIGQADFKTSTSAAVSASSLRQPAGVAIGPDGNLFVADTGNHRVLEYAGGSTSAFRVYGQPNFVTAAPLNPASAQTLTAPQGLYVDASYTLYVADTGNHRVMIVANTRDATSAGMPASMVIGQDGFDATGGGGGAGRLRSPTDVTVESDGGILVADSGNNRVLVFPPLLFVPLAGATAEAVVGQRDVGATAANWNSADGLATPEGLAGPQGFFLDRRDTLWVADGGNNRVLHFLKPATIAHAANPQPGVPLARGGMAGIKGSGLAAAQASAAGTPLPLALAGREVVINDEMKVPLAAVSAESISLQIPHTAPVGTQRIAVRAEDTGELIAGTSIAVSAVSPGLFAGAESRFPVLNQDGSANSAAKPAVKGTTIKVFGTGQGAVSPQINDGDAAPAEQPPATIAVPTSDGASCLANQPSVCVAIGTAFGEIQSSGLAPGLVGIWQLAVKLPSAVPAGTAVPLRAVINGVPSNIITIAIQ